MQDIQESDFYLFRERFVILSMPYTFSFVSNLLYYIYCIYQGIIIMQYYNRYMHS